jgi:DNA processing protein
MAALIPEPDAGLDYATRESLAFLSLMQVDGLGPAGIRALWEEHGSGEAASAGAGYPQPLMDLNDPPPVLHVLGSGWPDPARCVAVVGTRRATPYGLEIARSLGRDLARWGWTVVSGMASGVDAAAHAGALDGGGNTIGVLGTGHVHEYPRTNRRLYARMREHGWLVSEFDPAAGPLRHTFPQRNRIIAALSRAVVIVEAGHKSGALITARCALDAGREVLVVPSRIGDPAGRGSLRLLRQGAAVLTGVRDVFDAIGWVHDHEPPPKSSSGGAADTADADGPDGWLMRCLGVDELSAEEIAALSGRGIADALAALGRLEIDGRVGQSRGGRFGVKERPRPYARDAGREACAPNAPW